MNSSSLLKNDDVFVCNFVKNYENVLYKSIFIFIMIYK